MQLKNFHKKILLLLSILLLSGSVFSITEAQNVDELADKINDYSNKINELDKEINAQQKKLIETNKKATTLQSTVNSLDATEKKISTDIKKTQTNIQKSITTVEKLAVEIVDKKTRIEKNAEALAETIREINELESTSLLEVFLIYGDMSVFWNTLNSIEQFQDSLQDTVVELRGLHQVLNVKKVETEGEKNKLEVFEKNLSGEKEAVSYTKKEKSNILASTRNEEASYQKLLAQKLSQRKEFEAALLEFESQLKTLVDPGKFPEPKRGVIGWPVSPVVITQLFGGTQFAKNNPHIYGRPLHNGTDFGVPIGTKVVSVLDGTVEASGNTDAFPGCYSWGKWVLVRHNNGLSSLYAHNSSILVSPGQAVVKGETISLSGNTGFSTGPHLHLTLYATEGVEVRRFNDFKKGTTGCSATGASTPVAPLEAYIDPMIYLPQL